METLQDNTRCPDLLYTLPNATEPCTGTWEDLHGSALQVIRITFIISFVALLCLYARPMVRMVTEKDKKVRERQKFKRAAAILFFVSCWFHIMFYALGNGIKYPTTTIEGCLSITGVQFGSVFMFAGCGCIMLMIQQVFVSSCGKKIRREAKVTFTPLLNFMVPYTVSMLVVNSLTWAGVIGTPILATRVALGCAIIPSIIYGAQTGHYIKPVIAMIEESISSGKDNEKSRLLRSRAKFLRNQRVFTVAACTSAAVLFGFLSIPDYIHRGNGLFMVITQTYNETVMLTSALVVYKLMKESSGSSKVGTTTSGQSVAFSSGSTIHEKE